MISLSSNADFESASTEVLNYLHDRLGFRLWMVTRTESDDWIVLNARDHGYDVKSGDIFRWTDSFCSRMVVGKGPRIAPVSDEIPAYAEAPIGQQVKIGAYVGVPLRRSNGELFGTLCAIDPQPMDEKIADELPLVEMMARLLTSILENELKAQQEHRRAERAINEALTDSLTGLFNRRGWQELTRKEIQRCLRFGNAASVLAIDLDNLKVVNDRQGHAHGDALIKRTAEAITSVIRETDVPARIGGDEFALLAVQCNRDGAEVLIGRLEEQLFRFDVSASIGMAVWQRSESIEETFAAADKNMYTAKNGRKSVACDD